MTEEKRAPAGFLWRCWKNAEESIAGNAVRAGIVAEIAAVTT